MKLKKIRVDQDLCNKGVWSDYMGTELLVASAMTKQFRLAASELMQELRVSELTEILSLEDEGKRQLMQLMASHLFLGFRKIEEDDGKPMEDTQDNRVALLMDPQLEHLGKYILEMSMNVGAFVVANRQKIAGN